MIQAFPATPPQPVHPEKGDLGQSLAFLMVLYHAAHRCPIQPLLVGTSLSTHLHRGQTCSHLLIKSKSQSRTQTAPAQLSLWHYSAHYLHLLAGKLKAFLLLETVLKPTAQQKLHVCPGFASQMEEGGHSYGVTEVLVLFDVVLAIKFNMPYFNSPWDCSCPRQKQYWTAFRMLPTLPINRELQSPPRPK